MKMYEMPELLRGFFVNLENGNFADENGEVDWEAVNQAYDDAYSQVDEKLEACGCYCLEQEAYIKEMKEAEKRMADRRKAAEKRLENFKNYLKICMEGVQYPKFESPQVRISFRKSQQVLVPDVSALPEEFTNKVVEIKADKAAIKAAIKEGVMVSGAALVDNISVQIK